jgi:cell division protein FtsN
MNGQYYLERIFSGGDGTIKDAPKKIDGRRGDNGNYIVFETYLDKPVSQTKTTVVHKSGNEWHILNDSNVIISERLYDTHSVLLYLLVEDTRTLDNFVMENVKLSLGNFIEKIAAKNIDSEVKTIIASKAAIPQESAFSPRQPDFFPQHETAYPQKKEFYPRQPTDLHQQEIGGYHQGQVIYPPSTVESAEKTVVELPGLTITEIENKVISTPPPRSAPPPSAASQAVPPTPDLPAAHFAPTLPEPSNNFRFTETEPVYSTAAPESLPTYYNLPHENVAVDMKPWNGPPPSWTGIYRVQSSSHESLETAMEAVTKLRRYGIDPKITRTKIRDKTFYRVSFGPWNTRREAAMAAEYVKQQPLGYFDAFVQEP